MKQLLMRVQAMCMDYVDTSAAAYPEDLPGLDLDRRNDCPTVTDLRLAALSADGRKLPLLDL